MPLVVVHTLSQGRESRTGAWNCPISRTRTLKLAALLTLGAAFWIFPTTASAFVDPVGIIEGTHAINVDLQSVTVAYPKDAPYTLPPSSDGYSISVVGAVPRADGVDDYYYSERFAYLCLDASLGQSCGRPGNFTLNFPVPVDGFATADIYLVVDWYDEYVGILAKQTITLKKRQDSYTIELFSDNPSLRGLAEVEPGKTVSGLHARVYDQNHSRYRMFPSRYGPMLLLTVAGIITTTAIAIPTMPDD